MELKGYTLAMVHSKNQRLANGKFVRDINDNTYGYISDASDKHNIVVQYTNEGQGLHCVDIWCKDKDSKLEVVEPYIVSNDNILEGDLCYVEGVIMKATMNHPSPLFCNKVVAGPDQIGWVYYEGPPHDRAWDYKSNSYVEQLHPNHILDILERENKDVLVEVQEICPNYDGKHIGKDCSCKSGFIYVPKLFKDKIIMHTYEFSQFENDNYLIINE